MWVSESLILTTTVVVKVFVVGGRRGMRRSSGALLPTVTSGWPGPAPPQIGRWSGSAVKS
jgi:hypothetical protein